MNETPNCNSCSQPMVEIGGIGKDIQIRQFGEHGISKLEGIREQILYQCTECKDIKIN